MGKIREGRWLCRSCGRENAGRDISCEAGCGVARPANVRFYLPENSPIITDPKLLAKASEKPNWNCDYCGGANPGAVDGAKVISCGHCGQARDAADTTYRTQNYAIGSVPRTDAEANPRRASRRSKKQKPSSGPRRAVIKPLLTILALCLVAALAAASIMTPASFSTAEVTELSWKRQITIEELRTVKEQGWSLPTDARLISSEDRVRKTIDVVVGYVSDTRSETQTVKVGETTYTCGTKDLGNGFFEDIECTRDLTEQRSVEVPYDRPITEKRDVIEPWYVYHIDRWIPVDTVVAEGGAETAPSWPLVKSGPKRRASGHLAGYFVTLELDDGKEKISPVSKDVYFQRQVGDMLSVARNIWGRILNTKPVSEN